MRLPCLIAMSAAALALASTDAVADCEQWLKAPLPAADMPDAAMREQLAGCGSADSYYAATPDYEAARLCAYVERDGEETTTFGGAAVLMMIYGNGRGTARDTALAKRFACEMNAAPAETDGRLEHLDQIAGKGAAAEPLDVCDDITSGFMMGECASRSAADAVETRYARTTRLIERWSAAHKNALATLREAAGAFIDAVVDGEIDMSGTARGAMMVGAREQFEESFLSHLEAFERGQLPEGDAAAYKQADAALNRAYADAMKTAKRNVEEMSYVGMVTPDGIRQAERAWITYRDAWVTFGALRYPSVPADAWRVLLTREREAMLREL